MSARSIRRAAERIARKAARQSGLPTPEPATVSPAQLAANRENSLKSTGPRTPEGKAKISLNAVKTGLTGHTVCLTADEAPAYQSLILAYARQFQPVGPEETALVQSIVDCRWRLDRIPGLEMALLNLGRSEFPDNHPSDMVDIQIMLKYEKEFRNLQLSEARLARRREKEMAELRRLQQERKAAEPAALERAATVYLLAQHHSQPFDYPGIGFEFSNQTFATYLAGLTSLRKEELLQKALAETANTVSAAA
jgi:hypothetical protein